MMGEYEHGHLAEEDDSDDIARFEKQCAARARAEGLPVAGEEDEEARSDDSMSQPMLRHGRPTASPQNTGLGGEWQRRCAVLQDKLARREAELAQVKGDVELTRKGGGSGDAVTELKQRLLDLSKKHRRIQVSAESQKSRIQQLEGELRKPREDVRKHAEEMAAQQYGVMLGDGTEDYKKKFLQASNKLQEARQEAHELRTEMQRYKKVLVKELGADEPLERALAAADDPAAAGWKGRAAQIAQLQRQLRERRAPEPSEADAEEVASQRAGHPRGAGVQERAAVDKAAEKRREEFEKLKEEVERLRSEQADAKSKRDGLKSRNAVLDSQVRELKAHVTMLVEKSENDDELVAAVRRQLGGQGASSQQQNISDDVENLRLENEELHEQLERQAQTVLQLQQKSLAASCEAGSVRLGPRSVETPNTALAERARFLEAENAKQMEHVRLLQQRLGDGGSGPGRPFSAESSLNLKERLRHMGDRLASSERENLTLRQRSAAEEQRPGSSASSCRSGSAGPRAALGPDMDQLLRQNEALKREIAGLRRAGGNTRDRVSSR